MFWKKFTTIEPRFSSVRTILTGTLSTTRVFLSGATTAERAWNSPMPLYQELAMQRRWCTAGRPFTQMFWKTPRKMNFPLISWRTSSQRTE